MTDSVYFKGINKRLFLERYNSKNGLYELPEFESRFRPRIYLFTGTLKPIDLMLANSPLKAAFTYAITYSTDDEDTPLVISGILDSGRLSRLKSFAPSFGRYIEDYTTLPVQTIYTISSISKAKKFLFDLVPFAGYTIPSSKITKIRPEDLLQNDKSNNI